MQYPTPCSHISRRAYEDSTLSAAQDFAQAYVASAIFKAWSRSHFILSLSLPLCILYISFTQTHGPFLALYNFKNWMSTILQMLSFIIRILNSALPRVSLTFV